MGVYLQISYLDVLLNALFTPFLSAVMICIVNERRLYAVNTVNTDNQADYFNHKFIKTGENIMKVEERYSGAGRVNI